MPDQEIPGAMGFPGGSDGTCSERDCSEESACSVGDLGSNPGLGRFPGGRHGNPLQYSCLENPHGQRSLVGYSPRSLKESDKTQRLSTAQHMGPDLPQTGPSSSLPAYPWRTFSVSVFRPFPLWPGGVTGEVFQICCPGSIDVGSGILERRLGVSSSACKHSHIPALFPVFPA